MSISRAKGLMKARTSTRLYWLFIHLFWYRGKTGTVPMIIKIPFNASKSQSPYSVTSFHSQYFNKKDMLLLGYNKPVLL